MSRVTRPTRTPISGKRNVLTMRGGDTKNFEYRIVNDIGDRVAMFEQQGYEVVTDPNIIIGDRRVANPTSEGSPVRVSVGSGVQGYLMRQKKEHYKEDQQEKQKHVDRTEGAIKADARKSADFGKLEIGN
jgi:hypothetical protein